MATTMIKLDFAPNDVIAKRERRGGAGGFTGHGRRYVS